MTADPPHIDREVADRLAGIEEIEDAVARREPTHSGHRIDEPGSAGHVRNGDELRARTDRALEGGEVELAGCVAVDHVDLDADARLQLEKCEIVGQVLGARRDDAIARTERNRVEGHVPAARGVFDDRDLVGTRTDQRGDGVVGVRDAIGRFGSRFVAADGGLACEMARDRIEDGARRQGSARVVEMDDVGHTGRVRSERRHVERHNHLLGTWRRR